MSSPTLVITLLALAALLALLRPAWGPGHHLEFAERVWRRRKQRLPHDVSLLLSEHKSAYLYGNLAADIITFKAFGGAYSHCHRWAILDDMRGHAKSAREEAFILGYGSHLAADTIAHNHYVPYHLARYARMKGLGHLYWEMQADRFVPEERWKLITALKAEQALTELDELVNRTVPEKALSMTTNKLLFNHVLLVSERERWRRGMSRLHPISSVQLSKGFLARFQDAATERVFLGLRPKGMRELVRVDANGKAAQHAAMRVRAGLLERWTSPKKRWERAEDKAVTFLVGMESPPP